MKMDFGKRKRKAISPVLATVILIAITLIAAIAIAGFVFGLFGSFTSNAQVAAGTVNCSAAGTAITCTLVVSNNGNANTNIQLLAGQQSLSYSDNPAGATKVVSSAAGTMSAGNPLLAGSSQTLTLHFVATNGVVSGSAFSGQFSTSNGGSISFAGAF